jgi:hypothetical protein
MKSACIVIFALLVSSAITHFMVGWRDLTSSLEVFLSAFLIVGGLEAIFLLIYDCSND